MQNPCLFLINGKIRLMLGVANLKKKNAKFAKNTKILWRTSQIRKRHGYGNRVFCLGNDSFFVSVRQKPFFIGLPLLGHLFRVSWAKVGQNVAIYSLSYKNLFKNFNFIKNCTFKQIKIGFYREIRFFIYSNTTI